LILEHSWIAHGICRTRQGIRLGILSAAAENEVSLVNLLLLRDADAFIGHAKSTPQRPHAREQMTSETAE
jgi:hypothetical protein